MKRNEFIWQRHTEIDNALVKHTKKYLGLKV